MVKRNPLSVKQNIWVDSQQVDDTDFTTEQNYNNTVQSSIINNHIGSGVLPEVLVQSILFDSSLESGLLDGKPIGVQKQPNDNNYGNQLEIHLLNSKVAGKRSVKISVIGLDFQGNLQFENFYFFKNEIQVSKKHFTQVLLLLFNDFIGNSDVSFNLGGQILIREANPMTLSRDTIMVSQEVQPNLFFRDFYLDGYSSLESMLQSALPLFNIDDLNIKTGVLDNKVLLANDVNTQIGQKFKATTNNIQKISLLLSVRNQDVGNEDDLTWTGDIIVSIYPLQSSVNCFNDITPNLPIEFSPFNIPLAQLSINYATLQESGILLDSVPQPVDFIFSNTPIASGNSITSDNYYAISIKRSGSADKCDILVSTGSNLLDDSRITIFTGSLWVDLPEEDLWYKVYTDAAKVSDGQAYESGYGISVDKVVVNDSGATVDYSFDKIDFAGNTAYKAVLSALANNTDAVDDQRTGQPILTRKQFIPQVKLLNAIDYSSLENLSEPLALGAIVDKNKKFYDALTSTINSKLYSSTIVNNEILIKLIDDPTDSVRFDTSVSTLASNLLNGDFINAKFIPDTNNADLYYRIADASLCSMMVGDVNNDGVIDLQDLELLNSYLNFNLNLGLPKETSIFTDGYTTTYNNGYSSYVNKFSNLFSVQFQIVNKNTNVVLYSGTDGTLIADPNDDRLGKFTSSSINFSLISNITDYDLIIDSSITPENYGGFSITSLDSALNVITIRKVFLTEETLSQMLRADIDGDFHITTNDGYLLESYINKVNVSSNTSPYPGPTSNSYLKIGTKFNVIKLKLEKYIDRSDDYTSDLADRNAVTHILPDIFTDGYSDIDGYFAQRDFYSFPVPFSINKKLTWEEYLVVAASKPKLIPAIFTDNLPADESCLTQSEDSCIVYPIKPDFVSGKNNLFVPYNLIIGEGNIQRSDGTAYKLDIEIGTITFEVPTEAFEQEHRVNVFDVFVAEYNNTGLTRHGFKAMKFADCTYVSIDALNNDQVRFAAAVQSFSPNIDGFSYDGYSGPIVDGRIGVAIDYETGDLTLNFTNLYQDSIFETVSTKIQITVYLKKAGFNNNNLFVSSDKVKNLLGL